MVLEFLREQGGEEREEEKNGKGRREERERRSGVGKRGH